MGIKKKRVALVGASGIAGQQFILALEQHPWFELTDLLGSERSAGKTYTEALKGAQGQTHWWQTQAIPPSIAKLKVGAAEDFAAESVDLIFTAVDSDTAKKIEPIYAKSTPVVSAASAFRMAPDVPLLIPGVNNEHHVLIHEQKKQRGTKGFIVPVPNCTTYGMACALKPIYAQYGLKFVVMTSLQASSGAGRMGGVLALDLIDNLIPYIAGEEEKVEKETQKILGQPGLSAQIGVSCTCTRVPVTDGHTEAVFAATEKPVDLAQLREAYLSYNPRTQDLPSAPKNFFTLHDDPFHPQPRIDRDQDRGMSTHIGRLRLDPALNGVKLVLLSHNTKAGAAQGAVLLAEFLSREGHL